MEQTTLLAMRSALRQVARRRAHESVERNGGSLVVGVLVLATVLAFALRVWAVFHPLADPGEDARAYLSIARALFEYGTYGSQTMPATSDWSPGAPLLFGFAFEVWGAFSPRLALAVIALAGTALVPVVYLVGRRCGGPIAGVFAAVLTAVYPTFIQYTRAPLPEGMAAFLLGASVLAFLWACDATDRPGWKSVAGWVVPGLLIGVTALVRPEYLPVGVLFAVLAALYGGRARGAQRGLVAGAVVVVALCAVILPWTVHNYLVLDRFVPISTGMGKVFYEGTLLPGGGSHVGAKYALIERYPDLRRPEFRGRPVTRAEARSIFITPYLDRVASEYPDMPRDSALTKAAFANIERYGSEDPLGFIWMFIDKASRVWARSDGAPMSGVVARIAHGVVLLAALVGLFLLARTRRREAMLLGLTILIVWAEMVPLDAIPRRNIALMPLVFVLAGTTFSAVVARLVASRAGPVTPVRP